MAQHPECCHETIDISNHNTWNTFEPFGTVVDEESKDIIESTKEPEEFSVYHWKKSRTQHMNAGFVYIPPSECAMCEPTNNHTWCHIPIKVLTLWRDEWNEWNSNGRLKFNLYNLHQQLANDIQNGSLCFNPILWKTDAELTGHDYLCSQKLIKERIFSNWECMMLFKYQLTTKRNFSLGNSNDTTRGLFRVCFICIFYFFFFTFSN